MIGTTIAHYRITAKLGQGGMGEVYLAKDTKLDREVAIKILPEEFAAHPERMARFEREAKSLAKLNHPNIAAIYGFDRHEGQWFLVLELIDGEDLSERLKRGPLPLDEALNVFQQIAEALEAAHAKGIVHRDLKPANIKIDSQGRVKVLDFGLAKARTEKSVHAGSDATTADSMAQTITSEFTMPGKVIGTAAYMSPEQSRGQEVDKRTDVWAFGCCLYEALTGKRPFKGQTTSDLLAEILKTDPDWTTLPPETPREVVTLLRRCLEKETRRRLRDIGDIAITLEETSNVSRLESTTTQSAPVVEPSSKPSPAGSTKKILQTVGSVVLALGFAYAVFDLAVGIDNTPGRSAESVGSIRSVAVLKIKPVGNDADLAVVANGLEADIRAQLSRIEGLERQPASRTVEKLAASDKLDSEIASELGVEGLVYGDITREGDELELNVSLNYGPTDRRLWETNFTSSNPKALETRMVLSLLEQFDVPLTDAERDFLARADNVTIEAYTEYRRGVDALDVIGFANADTVIAHFKSAIDKDAGFLPPYLHQAWALWWPTIYGSENTTSEQAFTKAYAVLADAEDIFPDKPIISITRDFFGMVSDFEFTTAKRTLDSALLESPNDPDLLFMQLWYLVLIESRYPDAMHLVNTALAEDPNRIAFLDAKAEIYSFMDDERKALELNTGIAEENQEDFDRLANNAFSYKNLGELDRALQFANDAVRVSGDHPAAISVLAEINAAMGNTEEAQRLLQEVEAKRDAGHRISHNWNARVEAQLGDTKAAVRSLRTAYENHEGWSFLYSMRNTHFTRLMADEPAFWDLVNEMGYPPFPSTHPLHDLEKEKRYGTGLAIDAASDHIQSLRVRPFTNNKKGESHYLTDTLPAALAEQLEGLSGLDLDTMDADAEVSGSYVVDGDQFVIFPHLKNRRTGRVWRLNSFTGNESDLLGLLEEFALAVAKEIRGELTEDQERAIAGKLDVDHQAYIHFRKGVQEFDKRKFAAASAHFEAALEIDGGFSEADAYAFNTELIQSFSGKGSSPGKLFEEKSETLENLPESGAENSIWRLNQLWWELVHQRAWKQFRKIYWNTKDSGRLSAEDPAMMSLYLSLIEGRLQEPLELIDEALAMEKPERLIFKKDKVYRLLARGEYDLALEAVEQFDPDEVGLEGFFHVYIAAEQFDKAREVAENVYRETGRADAFIELARIDALQGKANEAREKLKELESWASEGRRIPYAWIARAYGSLGDMDDAFRWLNLGLQEGRGDFSMVTIRTVDMLDLFWEEPRYWEVVNGMNLPGLPPDHPYFERELELRPSKSHGDP